MFNRNTGSDKELPEQKRKDKPSPAVITAPAKRDKDKVSPLEQFQERGYDSGFVYHEE